MKDSIPYIIAEAGVNHNGDVNLAKKLIDIAFESGADAVKFQTWKPGELTGKFAFKVDYLDKHTSESESRFELSKRLCLPYDAFRKLKLYCEKVGIQFLSTPDGFESLNFLVDELGMPIIKIGSTELNHILFLEAVGRKGVPVILSTGLGTLDEVSLAIKALRCGGGRSLPITVLQCTSEYPAPPDEMNINVIKTYKNSFNLPVGLSDHSLGMEAAIASVALGSSVIEKHFTIDRDMDGPDHSASLNSSELKEFVSVIRRVKIMLGDGNKYPTKSERKNMSGIRRSVVAKGNLKSGVILKIDDLVCKRPGTGISPSEIMQLVGRELVRDLIKDEPINWEDLLR
jgi:N,N'-diacetyllegionaminate synthase